MTTITVLGLLSLDEAAAAAAEEFGRSHAEALQALFAWLAADEAVDIWRHTRNGPVRLDRTARRCEIDRLRPPPHGTPAARRWLLIATADLRQQWREAPPAGFEPEIEVRPDPDGGWLAETSLELVGGLLPERGATPDEARERLARAIAELQARHAEVYDDRGGRDFELCELIARCDAGDAESAARLLHLAAGYLETGLLPPERLRRWLAPRLRQAADGTDAGAALGLRLRRGKRQFATGARQRRRDREIVAWLIERLGRRPLRDRADGAGLLALAAERFGVGEDVARRAWLDAALAYPRDQRRR